MKDQIQGDVERLALPGGRAVETKGHDVAQQYLDQRLRELRLQPYAGRTYDSTPTELLLMKRSLGPFLKARGMALPCCRADLDDIADVLLARFSL